MTTVLWVLILITNNNYFHDLKNYPEFEFRAYRTLIECQGAKYQLDYEAEIIKRFWHDLPGAGHVQEELLKPGSYLECVYEPPSPWNRQEPTK